MYSRIKPYIELCRASNLPTVWTNTLAAMILSGAQAPWEFFFPIAASMSLFYSAGMCLNDILDAKADRVDKSFRPVACGTIAMAKAWKFTILLFAAAFGLFLAVPYPRAIIGALILSAFIVSYNLLHKKYVWSIFFMAGCRLMIFIITPVALCGQIRGFALALGLLQFAYTLGLSAVARIEKHITKPFLLPSIPVMIACMSLIDGLALALWSSPAWLAAGIAGAAMTIMGQKIARGD
ncbi:MAG: UbiA family prenyltransferase [Desulfobacteraceae bacterium]|nr:UbiA family prenyltransferase [Desulfobacteraceae bacterium]